MLAQSGLRVCIPWRAPFSTRCWSASLAHYILDVSSDGGIWPIVSSENDTSIYISIREYQGQVSLQFHSAHHRLWAAQPVRTTHICRGLSGWVKSDDPLVRALAQGFHYDSDISVTAQPPSSVNGCMCVSVSMVRGMCCMCAHTWDPPPQSLQVSDEHDECEDIRWHHSRAVCDEAKVRLVRKRCQTVQAITIIDEVCTKMGASTMATTRHDVHWLFPSLPFRGKRFHFRSELINSPFNQCHLLILPLWGGVINNPTNHIAPCHLWTFDREAPKLLLS